MREFVPDIFLDKEMTKTLPRNEARIIKVTSEPFNDKKKHVAILLYGYSTFDTIAAITFFIEEFTQIRSSLRKDFCVIQLKTNEEMGVSFARGTEITNQLNEP